ncbi:MAG: efflux RND transporter permease subunit [Armatimonadetes bacterium]|nr:efflux RND transporter permease subunit [Armatimonadota bacterium]MDE2206147.1 efflux RND transporter permease subunit [Armatimonadota bacterium]
MNFARFSVTRPVAVTMRIAALVLLGAICFTKLPVDLLPNVSIPTVAVITDWPNVSPEEIETQVTRPIEQAVSSVANMYEVSSQTTEGSSTVRVQFTWGSDIGQGAVDVLQLVERARRNFPPDPTLETPIVFKYDPSQLPILIYAVSGGGDPVKLRTLLDNEITPILESADGVAAATVSGGEDRAILIDVDPAKLRAFNLGLSQISTRIAQENINLPAGIAKMGNTEYTIRSLGWFTSPQQIAKIPIGSYNGNEVLLGDVAQVKDSHAETRLYTRLNGVPACGVIVTKQSAANTVSTAAGVMQKVAEIQKLYPDLTWRIAYNQAQFISASVADVETSAIIGGILALLILLLFLRNVRSTLVVGLSIPISIISTFALLYLGGFTLNTMSLGGLALATGLIVDDAIVVLENIFRHIERDKLRPAEAAVSGTGEIASAVIASTLTIVVVFLPLFFIKGQAGQMFTQFALVVIFSLAVSLLDATTVVPMLASRLISSQDVEESESLDERPGLLHKLFTISGRAMHQLDVRYRRMLAWAVHHRIWVLTGVAAVTLLSFLLLGQIGTELMPATDSGDFNIVVKLPIGTALAKTNAVMKQVEAIVIKNPNVQTAFSAAGTTLSQFNGSTTELIPYEGSVTVKLKDNRKASTLQVMGQLRSQIARLAGVRPLVSQFDIVSMILSGGPSNVEVDVFGSDLTKLSAMGAKVMAKMRTIPGLANVDVNWQEATPEIQWHVNRQKAAELGLNFSDVANTVNTATNGNIASYYEENGYQYPIIVQFPQADRKTISQLNTMPLYVAPVGGGTPTEIELQQVAHPDLSTGPSEITRLNRQRYIAISGQPQGRSSGAIQADIAAAMKGISMPNGMYWSWGDFQKRQAQEFGGMGLAVFMAIALVYMLLASQFESFVHPLTVLCSIPLSAVGVILALFLTGRSFGLTAFIGLLMLVGIVVKNGILLVDYTNVLRRRGVPRDEAVLTAGATRMRPIMMTACTAVLGMLPLAIGIGKGSETQAPMATAVIGGLITSTILTLFVAPTVYTMFDDLGRIMRRDRRDLAGPPMVEPSVEAVEREQRPEGSEPITEAAD